MNRYTRLCWLALAAFLFQACSDRPEPTAINTEVTEPLQDVTDVDDGNTGGNPNFEWVSPVVDNDAPGDPFATDLDVIFEICAVDGTAESQHCGPDALEATEHDDHYKGLWMTSPKDRGEVFDIVAYVDDGANGSVLLGSLQLTLERGGMEAAGRTIPVKAWVGTMVGDCVTDARCNLGTVVDDDGGVVEVEDEEGTSIAFVDLQPGWSPGGIDRTVTIDCRDDTFTPPDGPLNTALDQLPLYCSFALEPPLEPLEEFTEPQRVGICEVITDVHGDAVLGKQSGEGPVELLETANVADLLQACDLLPDYPGTEPEIGLLGGMSSRLASVLRLLGPQPLYALRDGGVGGLVRSFSDINPVIPAEISGTLTDWDGEGIYGVTITLSDGTSTETDEGGGYSFPTVLDGTHTVAVDVEDLPQGLTLIRDEIEVEVTETDHYEVDFGPFVFVAGPENHSQAQQACVNDFGAQLASIHSQAEDDLFSALVDPSGAGNITAWIGGIAPGGNSPGIFSDGASGTYSWTDGSSWDFENWRTGTGEPNGSGPAPAGVQFWPNTNGSLSGWNDVPQSAPLQGYICRAEPGEIIG